MSKTRFCYTKLSIRVRWIPGRLELKDRQIGANYVNSLSESFLWKLVSASNKDFKWQLVYEFHLKAVKHISHGVKLSNYLLCWVSNGALERQWVLWTARRETAERYLRVEAWFWLRVAAHREVILQNMTTAQSADMQKVVHRCWIAQKPQNVQIPFIHFFLLHCDKKWFSLNKIQLCGFDVTPCLFEEQMTREGIMREW